MNSDRRADADNHCAEIANYYLILSFAAIQEFFSTNYLAKLIHQPIRALNLTKKFDDFLFFLSFFLLFN